MCGIDQCTNGFAYIVGELRNRVYRGPAQCLFAFQRKVDFQNLLRRGCRAERNIIISHSQETLWPYHISYVKNFVKTVLRIQSRT